MVPTETVPVSPLSPRGIVKSKTELIDELEPVFSTTFAFVPGTLVVVVPGAAVAVTPCRPLAPILP